MEQAQDKKLVAFLDSVSRTVIGKVVGETPEVLEVQNPVIVHVVPQQDPQTGQARMSLQLYPIFFREFQADKEQPLVWKYKKSNITQPTENIVFDFKLHAQYEQLFAPVQPQAQAPQAPQGPPQAPPQGMQQTPEQVVAPRRTPPQQQPVKLYDQ